MLALGWVHGEGEDAETLIIPTGGRPVFVFVHTACDVFVRGISVHVSLRTRYGIPFMASAVLCMGPKDPVHT